MALPQRKRTPSFSSSVLDSIYRSFDESDNLQINLTRSIKDNVSPSTSPRNLKDDKISNFRRALMDEEHSLYTRSSTNTTISSDFSSSEAESYIPKRTSRTLVVQGTTKKSLVQQEDGHKTSNNVKNRLKQPLSPGARLTRFLNSIFQCNAKKAKLCSVRTTTDVKTFSTGSCFSRTTYKSINNNNNKCNGLKRSVILYPIRVTIDGECRDFVHEKITSKKKPVQVTTKTKTERVTKPIQEEIKTEVDQSEFTCVTRKLGLKDCVTSYIEEEEEDDDDDAWSYSSSDLFELENHMVGVAPYRTELPVYETTDLKTNQAIARGLISSLFPKKL
ncbi:unnamed protein product [Cochlearia groenlandica]